MTGRRWSFLEHFYKLSSEFSQGFRPAGTLLLALGPCSINSTEHGGETPFSGLLGVCLRYSQPGRNNSLALNFFSRKVYLCSDLAVTQNDLTDTGTTIPEMVWVGWAVPQVGLFGEAWLNWGLGWLVQSPQGYVVGQGVVSIGLLKPPRPLLPSCALKRAS